MRGHLMNWTTIVPIVGAALLAGTWSSKDLPWPVLVLTAAVLAGSVLAAVQHAEVIAHKVGEPYGSLLLALAVTVIEVGLIVMLMSAGGSGSEALARDTVFSAVMITCNGIIGLSLLIAASKGRLGYFNPEGAGAALATVIVLATLTMVLPAVTESQPGPRFTNTQLGMAAVSSLVLWASFVFTQTRRHRNFFLPVDEQGRVVASDEGHSEVPTLRRTLFSAVMLLTALVAVVGLAKVLSPGIEAAVTGAGLPHAFVGVIIALLVLAPETLAASRNAAAGRLQTSYNLGYGSAVASIGLTIPTLAIITLISGQPLVLGLGETHMVLLVLTAMVGTLTVVPGRATGLHGMIHIILLASYIFLSAVP